MSFKTTVLLTNHNHDKFNIFNSLVGYNLTKDELVLNNLIISQTEQTYYDVKIDRLGKDIHLNFKFNNNKLKKLKYLTIIDLPDLCNIDIKKYKNLFSMSMLIFVISKEKQNIIENAITETDLKKIENMITTTYNTNKVNYINKYTDIKKYIIQQQLANPYIPLKNYDIAKKNMIELYDNFSNKLYMILSTSSTTFGSIGFGFIVSLLFLPVNPFIALILGGYTTTMLTPVIFILNVMTFKTFKYLYDTTTRDKLKFKRLKELDGITNFYPLEFYNNCKKDKIIFNYNGKKTHLICNFNGYFPDFSEKYEFI